MNMTHFRAGTSNRQNQESCFAQKSKGVVLRATLAILLTVLAMSCVAQDRADSPETVNANGVEIAYRTFGPPADVPILFIQGIGGEMPSEPDGFLQTLVNDGYRVIVFDNRDIGASTHLDTAGVPSMKKINAALEANKPPPLPYTLEDMAHDALGLLDALTMDKAHIVGGSAGGMTVQLIAADHPERVCSLTLISSSNNNPELPSGTKAEKLGELPDNMMRQSLAAGFVGDLRARDSTITAPTVVVHGSEDKIFPPPHGRNLETSIPTARLVAIEGMGHVPDSTHAGQIAMAIESVIARARNCTES